MKTWISLLLTGALLVIGSSSAQAQTQTRLLGLSKVPVIINAPGHYVLARNWTITEPVGDPLISVVASNVIVDLRGFTIEYAVHSAPALISISGDSVTVKNGRLVGGAGDVVGPTLIHSTGGRTVVNAMTLTGPANALILMTGGSSVLDSVISSRTQAVIIAADSLIQRTRIACTFTCLELRDRTRIVDSRIEGIEPLQINGNGNYLLNSQVSSLLFINGNWNVLRGNLFTDAAGVSVNGTGNVLDGNIIPRGPDGEIVNDGIRFTVNGNFYGSNRVGAAVPFDLGATTQTDWGGNVGF